MEIDEEPIHIGSLVRGYAAMFLRHKYWILLMLFVSSITAFLLFRYLPKVYLSSTLILIEDQKVPEAYVKSSVSGTVEDRLSTIQQQILSRSFLRKTIEKLGLYKENPKRLISEDVVDEMRENIAVRTIGEPNVEAFSLSFQSPDPVVAMKVVDELASLFIEQNLKVREQLVEGTTEFLDNELTHVKQALEKQEERIGAYKRAHMGELPQEIETNLRALDRYQSEIQTLHFTEKSVEDRMTLFEKSLEAALNQPVGFSATGMPTDASPMSATSPSPLAQRLIEQKNRLANLQGEYRETYPDVITLKLEIAHLEEALRSSNEVPLMSDAPEDPAADPADAAEALRMASPFVIDLQNKMTTSDLELRGLKERAGMVRQKVADLERRVQNMPVREQEMMLLTRDYENTRQSYEALLGKKINAKVSENLEKRQKGEQFRVVDPANLPEWPVWPDPLMLGFGGPLIGLALGVGIVFLMEMFHVLIRTPESIERMTGVPVFASIPDFQQEIKEMARGAREAPRLVTQGTKASR